MKKWVLKAVIQKVISWLPGSQRLNFFFQKYITKGVRLSDQYFSDKLGHAIDHLKYYKQHGSVANFTALELGSGWYPVVPVALYLAGAKEIRSVDVSDLMNKEGIAATIEKYLQWHAESKLEDLLPFVEQERLENLRDIKANGGTKEDLLKSLHLTLQVRDARKLDTEDGYYDLVCSNNTFEHIYPVILKDILIEFQRVLKKGGVMSHFIDMSDHFAHLDQSISIYNFLRFSPAQWRRIDNSVQPQNRLRLKDYEEMYSDLNISITDKKIREGKPEDLKRQTLHSSYDSYTDEELAVSHAHLISGK